MGTWVRELGDRRGSAEHRQWLKSMLLRRIREEKPIKVAAELAGLIDKLEQERIRDPLTGAFNRVFVGASLQKMIEAETGHGHRVGLMLLDIDHFKSINDAEPDHHQAGDRTLVALVKILERVCPSRTVGRWGGEEWIIVMPHALDSQVKLMATRIGGVIKRQLAREARLTKKQVTASIGATLVAEGETPAAAIKRVDGLMYMAKEGGRAGLVFQREDGRTEVVEFA